VTTLTHIRLNLRSDWVCWWLHDPVAIHRRVMRAFPEIDQSSPREVFQVLWRLDTEVGADRCPFLLVQSERPGSWENIPDDGWATSIKAKEIDPVLDRLHDGQRCRFLIRANVTRKIETKTGQDGLRRNGRRVPIRSTERALEWLSRKGQLGGFELGPSIRVDMEPRRAGKRKDAVVTVQATRFEGELVVTDAVQLAESVRRGIGPAKAYGCGLLSVVPLSE